MVIGVEDVVGDLATGDPGSDGKTPVLSIDRLADRIVNLILARESGGKLYGTVVLAEGLAEMLPESYLREVARDDHGHVSLGRIDIGKLVARVVGERYETRTGKPKKLTGVQLGYEARCAAPHAFDVILGSQLGLGAYDALTAKGLDGHMVSVSGQLDLRYVPFAELVHPETLKTEVRFISRTSDFHRLATQLGTKLPTP
jgi:6-phosphofructokinase 1